MGHKSTAKKVESFIVFLVLVVAILVMLYFMGSSAKEAMGTTQELGKTVVGALPTLLG
jgi:preprotein translocase subunit YajC